MLVSQALILLQLLSFGGEPGSKEEALRDVTEIGAESESGEPSWLDPNDFRFYWKDSLRGETEDGRVKFRLGGRSHHDFGYIKNNEMIQTALGVPQLEDGTGWRRARLYLQLWLYDHLELKAQYDFAGGVTSFKDVFLGTTGYDVNFRIGQFKEPFSLEEQTSSNNITFLERSLANSFSPARSTGLMAHGNFADTTWNWAAGVFRDSNNQGFQASDADYSLTARLTTSALSDEDNTVHLGLSFSHRDMANDVYRVRARPGFSLAPRFVDTGTYNSDTATLVNLEAAWVHGRASLQGEYTMASSEPTSGDSSDFSGFYVAATYFLTDDSRNYKASNGTFSGLKPSSNAFDEEEGCGAWQAKLRYDMVDLSDGPVLGGELSDITVGLNWFLNPNMRVMFDVISADLDGVDSTLIGAIRTQFNF